MITTDKAELILKRFNDWADDLISMYKDMPPLSEEHNYMLDARIGILQAAKFQLARIVREIQ